MKATRKMNNKKKKNKALCIYIWQEESEHGTNTYIDHVGDDSLLEEYNDSIIREQLEKIIYKKEL